MHLDPSGRMIAPAVRRVVVPPVGALVAAEKDDSAGEHAGLVTPRREVVRGAGIPEDVGERAAPGLDRCDPLPGLSLRLLFDGPENARQLFSRAPLRYSLVVLSDALPDPFRPDQRRRSPENR